MSKDVIVGIIGSGFMARTYAECITQFNEGVKLVAVGGGKRASKLALDYGIDMEISAKALIGRDDIDAVVITTPEQAHTSQTLMAANAGKHILLEKPMAPSLKECDTIIPACLKAKVKLMQVKHWRFRGVFKRTKEILESGVIGNVRQLSLTIHLPLEHTLKDIENKPFYLDPEGGGMYMGVCSHAFDLMRFLSGSEASHIYSNIGSFNKKVADLSTMAQVNFKNGIMAQLWMCSETPGDLFPGSKMGVRIIGEKGLLDVEGLGKVNISYGNGWETLWEQPAIDITNPKDPVRLEAYSAMTQEFVNCIREDRDPSVTGNDGRAAVRLCLAGLKSSESGQRVTL